MLFAPVFWYLYFCLETLRQPCRAELPLFTPCRIARLFFFNWKFSIWHWLLDQCSIWSIYNLYAPNVKPVSKVNVTICSSWGGRVPGMETIEAYWTTSSFICVGYSRHSNFFCNRSSLKLIKDAKFRLYGSIYIVVIWQLTQYKFTITKSMCSSIK